MDSTRVPPVRQDAADRFTRVPDGLHDLVLSPREFQITALLLSYRWTPSSLIYPSVRTLAARIGCSERTVQRTCAALESRGLLVREARYRDDGGQQSSVYHLAGALLSLVVAVVDAPPRESVVPPVTRTTVKRDSGNRYTPTRGREPAYRPPTTGLLTRRNGVICRT